MALVSYLGDTALKMIKCQTVTTSDKDKRNQGDSLRTELHHGVVHN